MRIAVVLISFMFSCSVSAQVKDTFALTEKDLQQEKQWKEWWDDLHTMGVSSRNHSIFISDEAKKINRDTAYRNLLYPKTYTWETAIGLLKAMDLKKGFWYLLNLYQTDTVHRKLVIESLLPFDAIMQIDKVVTSSFYSYALLDPKVYIIRNGKMEISRPDILEKEFNNLKEVVGYITYYRNLKKKKK